MDIAAGGKHLRDYWSILVRRRWIIYLSVVTVTLAALLGSFLVTPQYRATTTLQIERQNPDIFTFRDLAQVDQSWSAYADFYQTQYKIIASRAVARKAVERIDLASHDDFGGKAAGFSVLGWLRSLIPTRGGGAELDPLDAAALQLLADLTVDPVRNSHLVEVSWTSTDPELAARVANAISDAYLQYNLESQYSTSGQAEEFLLNQIATLEGEITELETRLQEYGEAKRIVSIDDTHNVTFKALQDISAQLTDAQTALARADAEYRSVVEAPADALPEVMRSELVARLRQESAAYEAAYSEKARQFKDDWPGLLTLRSKLDRSHERLEVEVARIAGQVRAAREAAWREASAEAANLERLFREQEEAAQRLKRDAVKFATLQSEVQKKRETLAALIRRQNEMALSTRIQDPDAVPTNVRIVERARPAVAPFRPNTRINLLLGMFFGLTLGVGTALFLDYLDNTISSAEQLARVVSLPLLALVPRHGGSTPRLVRMRRRPDEPSGPTIDLVAHADPRSEAAEAYRELRTSILLSGAGSPPRTIVVTSSFPEEGKTATAINLAIVLAQLGRRVLLVDADLRRPRIHDAFSTDRKRGTSGYLSGLERDLAPLLRPTAVEHLDLLCSGPIPPNPSELLNSVRFGEMTRQLLDRRYDHVVFDSPPALSVSDSVILGSHVDLGILVVRAGRTPRHSVRLCADRFKQSGSLRLGVVLNDLDVESLGSTYRSYRHYGRYGEPDLPPAPGESRVGSAGA